MFQKKNEVFEQITSENENAAVSHNMIVCDLFQKKDEVFEQITSEDENEAVSHNIIVCDLFQKKDKVFEQITSEDENENEEPGEEYYLTRGVQEQLHIPPSRPVRMLRKG